MEESNNWYYIIKIAETGSMNEALSVLYHQPSSSLMPSKTWKGNGIEISTSNPISITMTRMGLSSFPMPDCGSRTLWTLEERCLKIHLAEPQNFRPLCLCNAFVSWKTGYENYQLFLRETRTLGNHRRMFVLLGSHYLPYYILHTYYYSCQKLSSPHGFHDVSVMMLMITWPTTPLFLLAKSPHGLFQ